MFIVSLPTPVFPSPPHGIARSDRGFIRFPLSRQYRVYSALGKFAAQHRGFRLQNDCDLPTTYLP
jgi:hypothetical protein